MTLLISVDLVHSGTRDLTRGLDVGGWCVGWRVCGCVGGLVSAWVPACMRACVRERVHVRVSFKHEPIQLEDVTIARVHYCGDESCGPVVRESLVGSWSHLPLFGSAQPLDSVKTLL